MFLFLDELNDVNQKSIVDKVLEIINSHFFGTTRKYNQSIFLEPSHHLIIFNSAFEYEMKLIKNSVNFVPKINYSMSTTWDAKSNYAS